MPRIKRRENSGRHFDVTVTATSLTLECRQNGWTPENLVIHWHKNSAMPHTMPIPWQPEDNNPFRGVHVWPSPNPVGSVRTLYQKNKRDGTYHGHQWEIMIKNESESGKRKVLATGVINVADYISHEWRSFDIKLRLKPSNKNVVAGSIDFKFSSVMLLDGGIPYSRNKDELINEILTEAYINNILSPKVNENIPMEDTERKAASVLPSSEVDNTLSKQKSKAKENSIKPGSVNNNGVSANNNKRLTEKQRGKAPPPPRPLHPPNHQNTPASVSSSVLSSSGQKKGDIKEVHWSSGQGKSDEKATNNGATSPSGRRKERRKNKEARQEGDDHPSSLEAAFPPCNTLPEGLVLLASKRMRDDADHGGGYGTVTSLSDVAFERGKGPLPSQDGSPPFKGTAKLEELPESGEKYPRKIADAERCYATGGDEIKREETADSAPLKRDKQRLAAFYEKLLHLKHPKGNRQETAPAARLIKTEPEENSDSSDKEEKQRLAAFYQKLLHPESHKGKTTSTPGLKTKSPPKSSTFALFGTKSSHPSEVSSQSACPEMSAYANEEMRSLEEEVACLDKVLLKVEVEMRHAMGMNDCKEEVDSLMQDWLVLNKYTSQLASRKQDLHILVKQEDVKQCINIMRNELQLLFEVPAWRKSARHRCQEAKLLDLVLMFANRAKLVKIGERN